MRKALADTLAVPIVDLIFMCSGIGPEFLEHVFWVLKGLAGFSLSYEVVLDHIMPHAYPAAPKWATAMQQLQTSKHTPATQDSSSFNCMQLCRVAACKHHCRHCHKQRGAVELKISIKVVHG